MISLVSTVRAPKADLERFVAYYLNTGIDHLYLYFDDPTDPALSDFTGLNRVTAIACTPQRWRDADIRAEQGIEARQGYNANEALAAARAQGAQWLLHVDSDELIYTPGSNLAVWLAERPAACDAVIFPVLEAVPPAFDRRHPFEACRMFKTLPNPGPARRNLAARLGCRHAFRYGYFRGHMVGKSATRVTAAVDTVGIHVPKPAATPLRIETAANAYVLHYDGCTFDNWRQKWSRRKDGSALALNMRPDRRRQFADFLIADEKGSAAALENEFRRQCLLPVYEQLVLWALGLARPIYFRPELFKAPNREEASA